MKLLIADDDVGTAEALAVYMRLSGFDVETVFDGLGAIFALNRRQPHAAFLDIDMPGATGLEVARAIRLQEANQRHTLLIAMTGRSPSDEAATTCAEAGFDHHVSKPASPDKLLQLLRDYEIFLADDALAEISPRRCRRPLSHNRYRCEFTVRRWRGAVDHPAFTTVS